MTSTSRDLILAPGLILSTRLLNAVLSLWHLALPYWVGSQGPFGEPCPLHPFTRLLFQAALLVILASLISRVKSQALLSSLSSCSQRLARLDAAAADLRL